MVKFKKSLALLLSLALVVCLAIPGLVLPVSADDATTTPVDLFNGIGDFEEDLPSNSGMNGIKTNSTIVNDPAGGTNKVAMIPTQEKVDKGDYTTSDIWFQFYNLHNAETGNNNMSLKTDTAYRLTFRIYGGKIASYIMGGGMATAINGVNRTPVGGTWITWGDNTDTWQNCSLDFYVKSETTSLNLNYILNFAKTNNGYADNTKATYIDDVKLVEVAPESMTLDVTAKKLKTSETVTLTASVLPLFSSNESIAWTSSNTAVATVKNGVVTAKAEGKATITASVAGLSATCAITVDDNMLADGDIANGNTGTWKDMPGSYTDASGNTMLKIAAGTPFNSYWYWKGMDKLGWEAGQTYLISFDVKGDQLRFQIDNTQNVSIHNFTTSRDTTGETYGEWQRIYTTVATDKDFTINGDYSFSFKAYANGSADVAHDIYIDNVRIVKMPENFKITEDFNGDTAQYFFWAGFRNELIPNYGATVVADPDDAENNVLKVPKVDSKTAVYFPVPDLGTWDRAQLHRYTIRHKGGSYALVNASAHATMLQTTSTTGADGWTTTTYVVDINKFNVNYNYMIGLWTPTDADLYIDSVSWEHIDNATGITLNKTAAELSIGETLQLTATEAPVSSYLVNAVTWSSSDTSVATVSGTGLVTAKKGGTVTITATSGAFTATCDIEVAWPVEQFPNGDMEAANHGISFYKANNTSGTGFEIASGYGVNGSVGLKLDDKEAKYIYKNDYAMRPNSTYLFSYVARSTSGTDYVQIGLVGGNCPDVTMYGGGYMETLSTEWTRQYVWLTTGDAPSMNSAYNLYFHVRSLATDGAIYVDNLSLRLIEDGDSILPDLSFAYGDQKFNTNGQFVTSVVAEPGCEDNNVLALSGNQAGSFDLTSGFPLLESYAMYEFTFDYKMNQTWIDSNTNFKFWIGQDDAKNQRAGDSKFYDVNVSNSAEWTTKTVTFFTNSMTKMNSNTFYFVVGGNTNSDAYCYIDNVTLKRVDSGHSLNATISGGYLTEVSIDSGATWHTYLKNVPAGTVVDVKVTDHGAQPTVLKSLVANTKDGDVAILNKDVVNGYTADNFGSGDGRRYQFIMGDNAAHVAATLIPWSDDTQDTYYMDTMGTSLHYNADSEVDGIRFLTRLQLKKGTFNAEDEHITVRYNGTNYAVVGFGSILTRVDALPTGEELTFDNAKWRVDSYTEHEEMVVLDYTKSYIDFTVVMKKGASLDQATFEAREYVARGYIQLMDLNTGMTTTEYTESTLTDSVDAVQARM